MLDRKPIPRPHGVSDPVVSDIRLIFASNKTLDELKTGDLVQKDLLDRLLRWVVEVPCLRDRKEDIICFVEKWCVGHGWDHRFLLALTKYDWPGNVRELREVLDLANRREGSPSGKLTLDYLEIADRTVIEAVRQLPEDEAQREVYLFLIKAFVNQGLRKGKGLQERIASFFGVGAPAVSKKFRQLGINTEV